MAGLTKEQIFKAAEQLVEQGKAPTLAEVRKLLGNGSFSTISEAMKEWREQQNQPTTPIREAAPQAVAERLEELGAEIWSIALGFANERLKAEREALEAARIEMEEQQRETAEMADQLAAEIEQLREQNKDLSFGLDTVKRSEQAATDLWQEEKNENIKLQTQVESAKKRIEDLQEEIRSNRMIIEADRKDRERIAERDRKQVQEIEQLKAELKRQQEVAKTNQDALEDQIDRAQAERNEARDASKKAQEIAQAAQIETAQLRGELEGLRSQVNQQAEMFKTLTNKLSQPAAAPKKAKEQPTQDNGKKE